MLLVINHYNCTLKHAITSNNISVNGFFYIYMNIVHTNKYNKKLQSPGALNIKETPGYKQKENAKK